MVRKRTKELNNLLTREFFEKEYFQNNKSLLQISKNLDISFSNIQRYFHKHNLSIKRNNISKKYLIEEYFNKKLSQREIAENLNLNVSIIHRHFKKYNLEGRKNIIGKEHHSYKHGLYSEETNPKNSVRHRKLINKNSKCEICNQKKDYMDIHHKDFNHLNNDRNNLQVLCHSCHSTFHRNYEWNNTRDKNKILRDELGRFKNKNETTKTNN